MKTHLLNKILFLFLVFPVQAFSQSGSQSDKDLTGMWKGQLYNDTTQKYLPYELAISEEKGKLTGYSYTLFEIDGKKELGVKRIRIRRKNTKLIIEDVEMISNTFSVPVGRGVKWMGVANLLSNDSIMELIGDWSTAPTREFRPLTGSLHLERKVEFRPQVLFKKLEELNLDQSLSFVRDEKKPDQDIAKLEVQKPVNAAPANTSVAEPDAPQPKEIVSAVAGNNNIPAETLTVKSPVDDTPKEIITPIPERIAGAVANTETQKKVNQPAPVVKKLPVIETVKIPEETKTIVINKPVATPVKEPVKKEEKPMEIVKKTVEPPKPTGVLNPAPAKKAVPGAEKAPIKQPVAIVKSPEIKKPTVVSQPPVKKPAPIVAVNEPVKTEIKKPVEVPAAPLKTVIAKIDPVKQQPAIVSAIVGSGAAANVAERKISNTQDVFYTSDSLILTLYDNGDVDGDTVSVLMNGSIIFAKQGLSTRANNKTIYITEDMPDSIVLVMYAENLGSIPPNTGLLVVRDGEAVYDVRFKADLQSNAAIILRKRRKQ